MKAIIEKTTDKSNAPLRIKMNGWELRFIVAGLFLVLGAPQVYGLAGSSGRFRQEGKSGATSSSQGETHAASAYHPANVLVSPEEDYRIGPSDVIEIQIEKAPELSRSIRVNASGTFLMPYLGRITAVQKTPEELAQYIADRLRGDYLKDPRVTVAVKEYNSRAFFIQGAVRSPGVFQIEGRPSLLELITLAGGLGDNHGSMAFIIRRIKDPAGEAAKLTEKDQPEPSATTVSTTGDSTEDDPDSQYELIKVNVNALLKGNFNNNMFLEPRDVVNIPIADVFFIAGEVNAPGSFPLTDGTTLRQAISLAQGTTFKAATGRGIIFREGSDGKREEVHVDVAAVMSGKDEDVPIQANDIIIVPNSRTKTIGGALLRAFGLTSVTRLPIR